MNNNDMFLYRACQKGVFGSYTEYSNGGIYEAGFIYLSGQVNTVLLEELEEKYKYRMFICLSDEWEDAITKKYPQLHRLSRYEMNLDNDAIDSQMLNTYIDRIPSNYIIRPFDQTAFDLKPFYHGTNYATFEQFKSTGAGFAAWCGDEIVASASSFLSFNNEVELDVSVIPEHRKNGLGLACAASMILDCVKRGIKVHWDAQNTPSKHMAERLGYSLKQKYSAYSFVLPEMYDN